MRDEEERKMSTSNNNVKIRSLSETRPFYNNEITVKELLEDFTTDEENSKKCISNNDNLNKYSERSECNSNDADEFDCNSDKEDNINSNDLEYESEQFRR